jgi:hypothetical protein
MRTIKHLKDYKASSHMHITIVLDKDYKAFQVLQKHHVTCDMNNSF